MLYRLIVLTGPLKNQRITVDREPMTIGRAPDCQILLPDEEVALKHAMLEDRGEGGLHIRDLGTMYKIIVNGKECRQARLKHGDMVEIGRTRFLVQAIVAAEVAGGEGGGEERSKKKLVVAAIVVLVLGVVTWQRWPQTHPKVKAPVAEPEPPAVVAAPTNELVVSAVPVQSVEKTAEQPAKSNEPPAVVKTEVNIVPAPAPATGVSQAVVFDALGNGSQATQMTAEIQRMREDIRAMNERFKDLAQPPSVVTTMPQIVVITAVPPVVVVTAMPPPATTSVVAGVPIASPQVTAAPPKIVAASGGASLPTNLPTRPAAVAVTNLATTEVLPALPEVAVPAGGNVIRVLTVEQSRFRAGDEFDDMRAFNVVLSQTNPRIEIRNTDVRIELTFFDEDQNDGSVHVSRLVPPVEGLRPTQPWGSDRRCVVNATYMVAKDAKKKNKAAGFDDRYYGFAVRVFYGDRLQDEWALPRGLLKTAGEKLSPATNITNTATVKPVP